MDIQSVLNYLDKIDEATKIGIENKWSRFGDEWTEFSTPMNKEVRQKIKDGVPEEPLLYVILPYWFNKSEILEIYFKRQHIFKKSKLRKLQRQCDEFRNDVKNGNANKYENMSLADIARMTMKGIR